MKSVVECLVHSAPEGAGADAFAARYAARIAWPLALSGSTLTDWIDGPLARRRGRGPTRLGRVLDLELDSWLTLATTFAGARLGTLHALCLITPLLRYLAVGSGTSYEDVHTVGKSDRARNLGIIQMTLALASFAPFAGARTTGLARAASMVLLPIHVVALAAAQEKGATEAIFANLQGHLCEGTGSNVFYVVDGELRTPTLVGGCLAGVTRRSGMRVDLVVSLVLREELPLLVDQEPVEIEAAVR